LNSRSDDIQNLEFVTLRRSIGSTIFFEYGNPRYQLVTPKSRAAFLLPKGQLSIAIWSSDWSFSALGGEITNSDEIDDQIAHEVAKTYFVGQTAPPLKLTPSFPAVIEFGNGIVLEVNADPELVADDPDGAEISVLYADGSEDCLSSVRGFFSVEPR
jgi:hypothetical protein